METGNRHASLVLLGDRGILISGPSGAGKSALALELITHADGFAVLVGDDRVIVQKKADGRYVGSVPKSIAGLIEVRGLGVIAQPHEAEVVIDLVVELVDGNEIERIPEPLSSDEIALVQVPRNDCLSARQRIAGALSRLKS